MKSYLEDALDAEKYAEKQVKRRVFAARVFRFVFKDVLDDLIFIRETNVMMWRLCIGDITRGKLFHAMHRHGNFFMHIELSREQIDRIDRYFPAFASDWKRTYNGSQGHFTYREFPLKSMIEAAIGETILQFLDDRYGPLTIYLDDFTAAKEMFFKATNVEELLMKMDLESNGQG